LARPDDVVGSHASGLPPRPAANAAAKRALARDGRARGRVGLDVPVLVAVEVLDDLAAAVDKVHSRRGDVDRHGHRRRRLVREGQNEDKTRNGI
jgi:hypothetical protein